MSLTVESFTIGTAVERIVPGLHYSQDLIVENLEPANNSVSYAKEGFLYGIYSEFPVVQNGSAIFEVTTGTGGMQIDFYEILSTVAPVKASLIEGGTVSTSGTVISAYNVNRDYADDAEAVFTSGTAITGGSAVAEEYITADKHAVGGGAKSGKTYTLSPSTDYAFQFVNEGNQNTVCFFQLTFAEKFNGQNRVTIGDDAGNGFQLDGGERIHLRSDRGQSVYAVSTNEARIVVVRQN